MEMFRFNTKWFKEYHDWLEYNVTNDVAYYFNCYLFKDSIHQGGGEIFSTVGFKSWNNKKNFNQHIGGPNSIHDQKKKKREYLMRQQQSIIFAFKRQSYQVKHEY